MKQINLQDKNSQDYKNFCDIMKNHKDDINNRQFRNLILDVLKEFSTEGVKKASEMISALGLGKEYNLELLKIIGELTGLGEN